MHWVFGRCSVVTPITSHHNTTCRHVGRADGRPSITPTRLPALEGFKGGLIYVVGTAAGAVQVWDLSKQTPAGSVQAQGSGDEGVSIASIVMSDNGYHVATSTTAGIVQVWDLRKLKCVATLNADGADDVGSVVKSVSFSPGEGKLLAYGGANGTIAVVGVKDWDNKTTLSVTPPKKGDAATITGLVWTHGGMSMVSCSDTDRPVRFWGTKSERDP